MTRKPDGIRPQAETDAALFAHIAYRLDDIRVKEIHRYATSVLGIDVGYNAIRFAPATAARIADLPSPPLRPWLLVDLDALNFFTALVCVRNASDSDVFSAVARVPGVVHVMRLMSHGDVVAIVIYEDRAQQRMLRARLGEIADIVSWEHVDFASHEPAILTWRSLARRAGEREGLLLAEAT